MKDIISSRPRRTALLTLLAALAVAGGFLCVTLVTQGRARTIDRLASVLEKNALPSIKHLTAARGALRRVTLAARDLVRGPPVNRPHDRRAIEAARQQLNEEMAAYVELPSFPGERAQHQIAAKNLGVFDRSVDTIVARVEAGNLAEAQRILSEELTRASDRSDYDIEALVRLNADEASRTSDSIQEARVHATRFSYLLHALAGALVLLVLMAVARVNRSYQRLVEARARLQSERQSLAEQRATELDMFAARVAHDLKNPLAAVSIGISLANAQSGDPDKVRGSLARVGRALARTEQIIDGLLAFARSAGEAPDGGTCAELGEVLENALADVAGEIERTGAHVSIEPFGAIWVACSAGPLMSVLENLLGNAVKYIVAAPVGARRVRVRASATDARVRVEIEDTGPGIATDVQATIFERFVRGPTAGQPGFGLGLATVKRIIEAHGGFVGVRSAVGDGSCFWFELPRAAPAREGLVDSDLH